MRRGARAGLAALAGVFAVLLLLLGAAAPVSAQLPSRLVVTVTDNLDPAASGGQVTYAVVIKNDGTVKAKEVVVTIPMPPDTTFVRCTNTALTPCTLADGLVTTELGNIRAHLEVRVSLTLLMPTVTSATTVRVEASADSSTATDDRNAATTTVLPPGSFLTYLPSERVAPVECGDTLTPDSFGSDTIARLNAHLGCTSGPFGLKITAPGTTLDLAGFRIFWNTGAALGNVGVLVSDATDVTILGGGTGGGSGIELFDWCVKDEGNSARLTVHTLRCFRPRSAGIDIASKRGKIVSSLIDRATGTATTTADLPGGVGIRMRGKEGIIKNSIVRRSGAIGIWAHGVNETPGGRSLQIQGAPSTMRIENSAGVGLLLEGGPHFVKDLYVQGDGLPGEGKHGVVIGTTAVGSVVESIVVKAHGGHGIVVEGTNVSVLSCNVEGLVEGDNAVSLDGYVVTGPGARLSGNDVTAARRGYVVSGPGAVLASNYAEALDGDGFVLTGDNADAAGNSSKVNRGRGFVIGGSAGLFDTNTAEDNDAEGFAISGSGNTVKSNRAKKSGDNIPDSAVVGIAVSGTGNQFNSNLAELSTGAEWMIAPDNIDTGGNKASGSTFSFTAAGGTFD